MEDFFRVGVIANTHGIRGEVKIFPTTDDVKRFDYLKEAYIDAGKEKIKVEVSNVRYFKNLVIVKFKGIDNINDIERYKGKDLLVTRENALPLEEGEYYLADIIGANVYTEDGNLFGSLEDVIETGANLVYSVQHEGKEVLLPVIDDCVKEVNVEEKKVIVHIMKGLLD
ncbi:ribosome maturation factor RimM [Jutongia hominis]|jgi:16S rRNA processing protein RimM|uniref:Ribosome maturation factor RimM n=1 Tax=Jutongia hominis TaxID=2763664 RepID=A0ABR7MVP4_9FIRM|nr:ribosome maturation factor RimM [Jutongia hominis]MBC8557332.1 ribosome maturation factor RimM [Jutongia hominis]PWL66537.1 MAG: 16S rRNA processing protein RimM [Clostridiaceae bacterium]